MFDGFVSQKRHLHCSRKDKHYNRFIFVSVPIKLTASFYVTDAAAGASSKVVFALDKADYEFTGDNNESLVLHCVFAFEGLKEIGTGAVSTTAAGLVADESKLTALTSDIKATITKGSTANVVFTARDTVTKVVMTKCKGEASSVVIDSTRGKISGNTFTLLGSYASKFVADAEFTLTLSDGTTQLAILTVTE